MLFPTAGARLFIADSPVWGWEAPEPEPSLPWVEVGETEALGTLGGTWKLNEGDFMSQTGSGYYAMKGVHRPAPMQVILGLDGTDAGQALLLQAYSDRNAFPFRLLFPDGLTERRRFALVLGFTEVFDAANQVMRLQVEMHPCSEIVRTADA